MTFSSSAPSYISKTPLYFHRLREGETIEDVASRYNVNSVKLFADNTATAPRAGEVVVIDFKSSTLSIG
jgi:hypothetical protein